MLRAKMLLAVGFAAGLFTLAGCGGGDDQPRFTGGGADGPPVRTVAYDPEKAAVTASDAGEGSDGKPRTLRREDFLPADEQAGTDDPAAGGAADPATADLSDPASGSVEGADRREAAFSRGEKGQYGGGYLTEVVKARFTMDERIQNIQLINSLRTCLAAYKANHGGRGPATHEEYMKAVIQENGVRLPDLAENERYRWDPKEEKLWIEQLGN